MSRSGESAAKFLLRRGAEVYLYDDVESDRITEVMNSLEEAGAHRVRQDGLDGIADGCVILVLSPGIPKTTRCRLRSEGAARR